MRGFVAFVFLLKKRGEYAHGQEMCVFALKNAPCSCRRMREVALNIKTQVQVIDLEMVTIMVHKVVLGELGCNFW